ncbi:MAG: hypothetical protein A2538_01585 [Candidatus Magasanikbacteria bacterium RIFOXYD2_FULL_41_14]|uniref:Uncharacterized protein n=1 Tax=Candidatus Magasanikbacteria bacterium RIFOXYD2_FULL_41_14 TaxID=1798709 RepID=A0A1F6PE30_9BACT|nr:MAG: hypothetical protein A2538_01585 [Candidatus Magasanikbacteria bacterium RIFOXYD2_FULL_41_14]
MLRQMISALFLVLLISCAEQRLEPEVVVYQGEDTRVLFEVEGLKFEAVGFLSSEYVSEMLTRAAIKNHGAVGGEYGAFLREHLDQFPKEFRRYVLVTGWRDPGNPQYVSCFSWDGGDRQSGTSTGFGSATTGATATASCVAWSEFGHPQAPQWGARLRSGFTRLWPAAKFRKHSCSKRCGRKKYK